MSIKFSTAENLIKKTWEEAAGKKTTKHHFNSALRKFYFKKNKKVLSNYYGQLLPYINRTKDISNLEKEEFINTDSFIGNITQKTNTIKNSVENERELLRKKMEASQLKALGRGWEPSPYWE